MFDIPMLDVVIGITFVFVLVSTVCSTLRETLEAFMKTRAAYLHHALLEMLHDPHGKPLGQAFFTHPLIFGLYRGDYKTTERRKLRFWHRGSNLPSYIPSRAFALTIIDLAVRGATTDAASADPAFATTSYETLRAGVRNMQNARVQRALLVAIDSAQGDLDRARANIEAWYDDAMERVSGWYKRSTQGFLFAIALLVAVGLNINTLTIIDFLYANDAVRDTIVASAEAAKSDLTNEEALTTLDALRLPIGWSEGWPDATGNVWVDVFQPLLGFLMTAFAAMLGAPFWFDVLNKVTTLRNAIRPKPDGTAAETAAAPVALTPNAPVKAAIANGQVNGAATIAVAEHNEPPDDGCDHVNENDAPTPDEDLPIASGGVVPLDTKRPIAFGGVAR